MRTRQVPDASFVAQQSERMFDLLRQRAAVPREDLEYIAETLSKLKDERFKGGVACLIGWGDDERAEIETFVAIAIEVMKHTNVSKLREAARVVYIRHLINEKA